MATISKGKTFVSGETLTPTKLNDLVDKATISGIVNADISATAAIADTKLATITTASKVSGTAITSGNITTTGSIATTSNISATGTLNVGGAATVTGNLTVNGVISGKINVNWISKTNTDNNYVSTAEDLISANTSSGAFTIKLPASPAKFDSVTFADHYKKWETNNLTIDRNTKLIEGLAEDLTCNSASKQITLRYEEATIGWRIYT
jgi:hypothetical protein